MNGARFTILFIFMQRKVFLILAATRNEFICVSLRPRDVSRVPNVPNEWKSVSNSLLLSFHSRLMLSQLALRTRKLLKNTLECLSWNNVHSSMHRRRWAPQVDSRKKAKVRHFSDYPAKGNNFKWRNIKETVKEASHATFQWRSEFNWISISVIRYRRNKSSKALRISRRYRFQCFLHAF